MIIFNDELLIGNGQIDAEHRMLFDMINDAHKQIAGGHSPVTNAIELIQNLESYAETHFSHEEEYMLSINDPEYSLQKREHDFFREKISEYKSVDVADENTAKIMLEELLTFLAKWLYRHILSSDTLIGKVPAVNSEETEDIFAFTSKYYSGIDFIDEEHKCLFDLIRKTYDELHNNAVESDVERFDSVMDVLDELKDYTKYHFDHEENYMLSISYDGYDAQSKAHTVFIDKIENIYNEIGYNDAEEYLEDLVDYLLLWLSNHICRMDLLIPKI